MQLAASAIVCAVRGHGEHGAVARLLTREAGLVAGYVPGGRSRALRPVLMPGNRVAATFRARTPEQLASLSVELAHSRAPLHAEPLPAAAIVWVTALVAAALPEEQPFPALYGGLDALLDAIELAPSARGWASALIRFELLLLAELGFGLDLARCAATGAADDLVWVSPRTGRAVSRAAGDAYADRLLPLPPFLIAGGEADWPDTLAAARITGLFLERELLSGRAADPLAARERMLERMRRLG